ncbi:MAG: hydroxymethylbilane synthase [Chlorobi bacterium]|nr:hydroxymethylbilane synthase [Chlorobiota bacterium]
MTSNTIKIGTRGSELALWQAHYVRDTLQAKFPGLEVVIVVTKTKGDKILDSPLAKIGDKGLFTKEIENLLLDGTVDLAVHSLKDIPTSVPRGLHIAAVTRREEAHDVLIARHVRTIDDLPEGAVIATSSLRRKSQLLHYRPDLNIVDVRGNLNTRMKKFDSSSWDGMILAYAGVKRLRMEHRISQALPMEIMLPAVGQGALGIETRKDDDRVQSFVRKLDHPATHACTRAERALLRTLEGGCQIPIGAFARMRKGRVHLDAVVGNLDGTLLLDAHGSSLPDNSADLGRRLGHKLLASGAREILEGIRNG